MEIVKGIFGLGILSLIIYWIFGGVVLLSVIGIGIVGFYILLYIGEKESDSKGLPGTYESENTTPPKQRSLEERELALRERELAVREKAVAEAEKGKKVPLAVKTATAGVVGYKLGKKIGKW